MLLLQNVLTGGTSRDTVFIGISFTGDDILCQGSHHTTSSLGSTLS